MPEIDGEPGYCACCRDFHLLYRHRAKGLDQPADVCRECIALGDGELAWRLAGVTEDGYGYDDCVPPDLPFLVRLRQAVALGWRRMRRREADPWTSW